MCSLSCGDPAERLGEGEDLDRLTGSLQRPQRLHRARPRAVDHVDELNRTAEPRERRPPRLARRAPVVEPAPA
jgi:hypothetical protein